MSIHSLRLSGGCVGFCPVVLSISSVTEKQGWIFIKFMDRFDFGAGNDWLNCGGDLDQELILREKSCYVVSADLSCEVTLTEICIVFNFSQYCHIAKIRVTAADTLNLWYSSRDNNVQMWLRNAPKLLWAFYIQHIRKTLALHTQVYGLNVAFTSDWSNILKANVWKLALTRTAHPNRPTSGEFSLKRCMTGTAVAVPAAETLSTTL